MYRRSLKHQTFTDRITGKYKLYQINISICVLILDIEYQNVEYKNIYFNKKLTNKCLLSSNGLEGQRMSRLTFHILGKLGFGVITDRSAQKKVINVISSFVNNVNHIHVSEKITYCMPQQ